MQDWCINEGILEEGSCLLSLDSLWSIILFGLGIAPVNEEMATANAVLKEGSLAIVAPTKSVKQELFWGIIVGGLWNKFSPAVDWVQPCKGEDKDWLWLNGVALWKSKELSWEGKVKSSVMVGHGEDEENVAKPVEAEPDNEGSKPKFTGTLVVEPERNIFNAADVVLAMGLAVGGSGWLWFPS